MFSLKGKQEKSRSLCVHLHVLFCCLELSNSPSSTCTSSSSTHLTCAETFSSNASSSTSSHTHHTEDISTSRSSTLKLYANQTLPYIFSPDRLKSFNAKDAFTLLRFHTGLAYLLSPIQTVDFVVISWVNPSFILESMKSIIDIN